MMHALLPSELVDEIFLFSRWFCQSVAQLMKMRGVCRPWRDRLDSFPRLWRDVKVYNKTRAAFLDFQVKRAGTVDLHVFADVNVHSTYTVEWLRYHAGKISKLEVLVTERGEEMMMGILQTMSFPQMVHFRIVRMDSERAPFILSSIPTTFVHPSRLQCLILANASIAVSSIAAHTNLHRLHLIARRPHDYTYDPISLLDLLLILPQLSTLAHLNLSCTFTMDGADRSQPPTSLSSVRGFTYHGPMQDLDYFLSFFDLPGVKETHLTVIQRMDDIPSESRLRKLISSHAAILGRAVLRWSRRNRIAVCLEDVGTVPSFALYFLDTGGHTPCEILLRLLGGMKLPVRQVELNGGRISMGIAEDQEEVIAKVMDALPEVQQVTVSGIASVWDRFTHARTTLVTEVDPWRKVESVDFRRATVVRPEVEAWVNWMAMRSEAGYALKEVRIVDTFVHRGDEAVCLRLRELLETVVVNVQGSFRLPRAQVKRESMRVRMFTT